MLKATRKGKTIRLTLHLTIAALTGVCLFLGKAGVRDSSIFNSIGLLPAAAQLYRTDVWQQVYQRLPDLPMENQYVSKETGKVDPNSTLVSRLIRYHVYVKSRPPTYRFDWKLTMADYLGANEYLVESAYPGNETLRQNPMESDRAVIQKLTRAQREALVDALVSVFRASTPPTPTTATPAPSASPAPVPQPSPQQSTPPAPSSNPRTTPSLPKPGDAQLLLP